MNEMNTTDRALSWDDEFTNEPRASMPLRSPAWSVPALRAAQSSRPAPWQS